MKPLVAQNGLEYHVDFKFSIPVSNSQNKWFHLLFEQLVTSKNTINNNFKKFLKQLAKDIKHHGYKRVICVGHSGTVGGIQEIIQGGHFCPHYEYIKPKNPKQFVEYGSTLYMAAKYIMKSNEYKIVIPYNNLQLLEKE